MPRLSFWDYFLLSCVSDMRAPLSHFIATNSADLFNLPLDSLNRPGVIAYLDRLIRLGLIELRHAADDRLLATDNAVAVMDSVLHWRSCAYWGPSIIVGLTPQGGAAWERYARPRWSWFFNEADPDYVGRRLRLRYECGSEQLALHAKELTCSYKTTKQIVISTSWRPLYWKTLQRGFIIHVSSNEDANSIQALRWRQGFDGAISGVTREMVLSLLWQADFRYRLRKDLGAVPTGDEADAIAASVPRAHVRDIEALEIANAAGEASEELHRRRPSTCAADYPLYPRCDESPSHLYRWAGGALSAFDGPVRLVGARPAERGPDSVNSGRAHEIHWSVRSLHGDRGSPRLGILAVCHCCRDSDEGAGVERRWRVIKPVGVE